MKPGRNDPCPCGSGKKYKKCCHDKFEVHSVSRPLRQQTEAAAHRTPGQQEKGALVSLFNQQRYTEAKSLARSMTEIFPHDVFGWMMLGAVDKQMGRSGDALASMQKVIALSPGDADAHYNMGIALNDLDRMDEAEASYRRALYIKPNFVEALNRLALLLNAKGESVMALNIINYSLRIKETFEAKSIFVACAKHLRCTQDGNEIRAAMVRALTESWGRPSMLAQVSNDLIKLNTDIGGCITRAVDAWPVRLSAQDLFGPNGLTTLAADTLLCTLLDSAPICDIEIERFLTMARYTMLEAATGMTVPDGEVSATLSFYSALARQCFINEYVFSYTDDEIQKASNLRDSLVAALETKTQIPAFWLVVVATYFPLNSLPLAARLLDTQWPSEVRAVLVQQVLEPAEELRLRATIPQLTSIEDEVSQLVQDQYEENPYPRWVKTVLVEKSENIVEYLHQKLPLASFKPYNKSGRIDVLIAGCGTGHHSIQSAQQYPGKVLAIDLSMRSLSYAKRKTQELGLTSIEYAQADLLELGSLGRSFDVIETCGVLVAIAVPWDGWRVLLSLLHPGGFMKLGFYSEVARRNIVRIRDFIKKQGYGSTANEIRRCRQDLIELDKNADFGMPLKTSDFFSISACRDALFHVQEHRMTLTSIDAFLKENNLTFLGFEIDANVLHAYKLRFPDDLAATNLIQWQIFENENPDTFIHMYQFWIQKID